MIHLCLLHSSPLRTCNVGLHLPINSEKARGSPGRAGASSDPRTHFKICNVWPSKAGTVDTAARKAPVDHARYNCTHCVCLYLAHVVIGMQPKAGCPPVHNHAVQNCHATKMSAGQPASRVTRDKLRR